MANRLHRPGLEPGHNQQELNLGNYYQQKYRETFYAVLAAGEVKPLVIPWSFVGSVVLPLVYLSIPHTNRPWLYRMRWAVAAAVVYLNLRLMQTTSAGNEAVAYATGLLGVWGTIWALRLLIFTRPQWDAARVERRPGRRRENGFGKDKEKTVMAAPDESVRLDCEYIWQPFPSTAPFLTRLAWCADLLISFRGAGWNFSVPSIPHPPLPKRPSSSDPVRLDLIPLASRTGTTRSRTYAHFLRSRLLQFTLSYLTIDLLTTFIRRDPYYVLGPAHTAPDHPPLPALYTHANLPFPSLALPVLRTLPAMAGIIAGLHLYFSLLQLAAVLPPLSRYLLLGGSGARAELWQHPPLFGGFAASVLDRGLAGFWGGWWHQTFRLGFVAPVRWLWPHHHRHPHEGKGRKAARQLAEVALAFALSGVLHAAGGCTSVSRRAAVRPHTPVVFFLLQAVGVVLQTGLCSLLEKSRKGPRWVRRLGNLAFTALWLQATGHFLVDDMSRAGLWLFEPVPVSPLRMMGFGLPGERWWRWDGEYGLRWYSGRSWWESGIRL